MQGIVKAYIFDPYLNPNKMKTQFKIGQKVTFKQCSSVYTGIIVNISERELVIIDGSDLELYRAGYAVGSCVSPSQILSK